MIQFLAQWNGYEADAIHSLDSAEESRLVAAGLARYFSAGMDGTSTSGALIVPITATTELSIAAHNGNILRLDASRTLTAPEGLGTSYSCLVQIPIGQTLTADPTGTVEFIDTATPAGSAATRTRTQANNPNGVVIQSTGVANKLTISGS